MASTGLAPAGKVFQGLAVAFAAAVIPYYLVNVKKVFGGALRSLLSCPVRRCDPAVTNTCPALDSLAPCA